MPALTFGGGVGVGDGLGEGVDNGDGASDGDVDGIAIGLAPHAATITAVRPRTSKLLALTPPSSTAHRAADRSSRPEIGMTIGRLETALALRDAGTSALLSLKAERDHPIDDWRSPADGCTGSRQCSRAAVVLGQVPRPRVGYTKSVEFDVALAKGLCVAQSKDRLRSAAVVMASMLYSLVRVVLDAIATSLWGAHSIAGRGAITYLAGGL